MSPSGRYGYLSASRSATVVEPLHWPAKITGTVPPISSVVPVASAHLGSLSVRPIGSAGSTIAANNLTVSPWTPAAMILTALRPSTVKKTVRRPPTDAAKPCNSVRRPVPPGIFAAQIFAASPKAPAATTKTAPQIINATTAAARSCPARCTKTAWPRVAASRDLKAWSVACRCAAPLIRTARPTANASTRAANREARRARTAPGPQAASNSAASGVRYKPLRDLKHRSMFHNGHSPRRF